MKESLWNNSKQILAKVSEKRINIDHLTVHIYKNKECNLLYKNLKGCQISTSFHKRMENNNDIKREIIP